MRHAASPDGALCGSPYGERVTSGAVESLDCHKCRTLLFSELHAAARSLRLDTSPPPDEQLDRLALAAERSESQAMDLAPLDPATSAGDGCVAYDISGDKPRRITDPATLSAIREELSADLRRAGYAPHEAESTIDAIRNGRPVAPYLGPRFCELAALLRDTAKDTDPAELDVRALFGDKAVERQVGASAAAYALSWGSAQEAESADAEAIALDVPRILGVRLRAQGVDLTPQHLAGAADFFRRLANALHGAAARMQRAPSLAERVAQRYGVSVEQSADGSVVTVRPTRTGYGSKLLAAVAELESSVPAAVRVEVGSMRTEARAVVGEPDGTLPAVPSVDAEVRMQGERPAEPAPVDPWGGSACPCGYRPRLVQCPACRRRADDGARVSGPPSQPAALAATDDLSALESILRSVADRQGAMCLRRRLNAGESVATVLRAARELEERVRREMRGL